jgi:hypothetical protein
MAPSGGLHGAPSTAWRPGRSPFPCQHPSVRNRSLLLLNRSVVSRAVVVAAAVLVTAGCAARADTDAAAATGSAAASSAAASSAAASGSAAAGSTGSSPTAPEETAGTPFEGGTEPEAAEPVDAQGLTVTAVRAARHEGYDRVVFEFAGSGTPGWSVEYVDTPSSQGSGAVVDVPGEAVLQVTAQGTSYPYETGATELAAGPVAVPGTEDVQGVVYDATFEGTSVAWIGTSGRAPFRVYALTGPSRLVVEVAHAG